MQQEHITDETLPEAVDVSAPDGYAAGSEPAQADVITLADIEKELGKKFPNKEAALKSWKDTNSFVGRKAQQPAVQPQVDTSNLVTKEQYEEDTWFAKNSQLSDIKTIIKAVKKETNKSYDEVVALPEVKSLIDARNAQAEAQGSKSVLHGNSAVAEVSSDYKADFEKAKNGELSWAEFMAKHKGISK